MIQVHYALQTCDIANNIVKERITGTSKTEVSKRCVRSFLNSVQYAAEQNRDVHHIVKIFDDHSTQELKDFLSGCQKKESNLSIEFESLESRGIMQSIRSCYDWMSKNGKDLVYQVQDDYLFEETAIYEMLDVWFQIYNECDKSECIISPYNMWHFWATSYRNRPTPRAIICGSKRYWIQYYDMSCSFMTSHTQFNKHWDLYEKFFSINPSKGINGDLEAISLNYMLTQRGVLGITPVNSLALHMQGEQEVDPYIDWKEKWNQIKV